MNRSKMTVKRARSENQNQLNAKHWRLKAVLNGPLYEKVVALYTVYMSMPSCTGRCHHAQVDAIMYRSMPGTSITTQLQCISLARWFQGWDFYFKNKHCCQDASVKKWRIWVISHAYACVCVCELTRMSLRITSEPRPRRWSPSGPRRLQFVPPRPHPRPHQIHTARCPWGTLCLSNGSWQKIWRRKTEATVLEIDCFGMGWSDYDKYSNRFWWSKKKSKKEMFIKTNAVAMCII